MPAELPFTPGTPIEVEVVERPTNAAAEKTLVRVFRRSPEVKAEQARLRKARDVHGYWRVRSGRPWKVAPPTKLPVQPEVGTKHRLVATLQALRDLQSVERFVSVKAV